ncbi:rop guanine nucleotide exchange factor 14 [Dorcoceras hygrometricum]|uniref:Rop guanine nucleotide exchange factor 14 n=1 Tax=Dorcoceras hygrometricum TaxID=472368 RepID=A0A2Z7C8Z3_9LAMI|nr:rop guanine nucleotide exchange factor 14 [Dorcoceras hygrometricum]
MIELRKRSPTLPKLSKMTTGNDGNYRIKSTMNSALGFETQRTNVGENILCMGSDISIEDQVFLYINPVAAEICFKQIHRKTSRNKQPADAKKTKLLKYSNHAKQNERRIAYVIQLLATVTNKSLAAGHPDAGSKYKSWNQQQHTKRSVATNQNGVALPRHQIWSSRAIPAASYRKTRRELQER